MHRPRLASNRQQSRNIDAISFWTRMHGSSRAGNGAQAGNVHGFDYWSEMCRPVHTSNWPQIPDWRKACWIDQVHGVVFGESVSVLIADDLLLLAQPP